MSIYTELNKSNAPEFFDEEAGIRYVFVDMGLVSYDKKLSLIEQKGKPRVTERTIKTKLVTIEGLTPKFEIQMIYIAPDEQENPENQ